ncbi:MAG: sigma-70 family RNA polymerase sigma factor [Anaerolineales bacterium]
MAGTVPSLAEPADHERAFEAAFSEHYARVYGVLFRLLGDPAKAEDLTVETFWRLWQRAPRRADNLAGWLYRVAMRLGYNDLRAGRRRERHELEAGHAALIANAPPDPADVVELAQHRAAVRAVLDEMKPRDAQLLILRHSGFSYAEIAAALGLAPGSVGTLLARAETEFELRYTP